MQKVVIPDTISHVGKCRLIALESIDRLAALIL